jgi:hypothetical protein
MRSDSGAISQEGAETLAIQALGFLAGDAERLGPFMAQSGLSPETLRSSASSPGFMAAVLNHLMQDEALLISFAEHAACDPQLVRAARDRLDPPIAEE